MKSGWNPGISAGFYIRSERILIRKNIFYSDRFCLDNNLVVL